MRSKNKTVVVKNKLSAIEHFVDSSIPFLVIILAIIIVLEFFVDTHAFENWLTYADWFILTFFVADLVFKWYHVRKLTKFIRLYWLELIAVFPFYLLIRTYLTIAELVVAGERISEAQQLTHEAVLLRETRVLRETELIGSESKLLSRLIKFFQRFVRFVWSSLHLVKDHFLLVSHKHRRR